MIIIPFFVCTIFAVFSTPYHHFSTPLLNFSLHSPQFFSIYPILPRSERVLYSVITDTLSGCINVLSLCNRPIPAHPRRVTRLRPAHQARHPTPTRPHSARHPTRPPGLPLHPHPASHGPPPPTPHPAPPGPPFSTWTHPFRSHWELDGSGVRGVSLRRERGVSTAREQSQSVIAAAIRRGRCVTEAWVPWEGRGRGVIAAWEGCQGCHCGVVGAWELRHCCMRGASARRVGRHCCVRGVRRESPRRGISALSLSTLSILSLSRYFVWLVVSLRLSTVSRNVVSL